MNKGLEKRIKIPTSLSFPTMFSMYVHCVWLDICLTSFQNNLKVYSVIESDTEIGRMICSITLQDIIWERECEMYRPDKTSAPQIQKAESWFISNRLIHSVSTVKLKEDIVWTLIPSQTNHKVSFELLLGMTWKHAHRSHEKL